MVFLAFSILIFVVAGVTRGKIEAAYTALYIVFGIVFLVYPPVSLYLRSKRTLAMSEVLRGTLHYEVDEEGAARIAEGRECAASVGADL